MSSTDDFYMMERGGFVDGMVKWVKLPGQERVEEGDEWNRIAFVKILMGANIFSSVISGFVFFLPCWS